MPLISSFTGNFAAGNAKPGVIPGLLLHLDAANPVSYSGSGSTWYDLQNPDNNATLVNSPTYNSAGYFNFSDTSFQYATVSSLAVLSKWSIEVWVRFKTSLTNKVSAVVCNEFQGGWVNYSLGTNRSPSSYNISAGYYDSVWRTTLGFAPSLDTWYQLVGTFNGTRVSLYNNGTLDTTADNTNTPAGTGGLRINRRWDSDATTAANFFNIDLSIVRVYDRELSSPEVGTLFNTTRSRFGI